MALKGWWGPSQWMWALQKGAGVNSKPAEGFTELGELESFLGGRGKPFRYMAPTPGKKLRAELSINKFDVF